MPIIRMTLEGEARQIHPVDSNSHCNCHELIAWIGNHAYLVGEGIEVDGELAKPSDWIVKIDNEVRVVKAQNFAMHYEFVKESR